ncbi:MAG: MauE/DoxX family redox-associated membrane protein [Pyrinomonadaceae bacterium]
MAYLDRPFARYKDRQRGDGITKIKTIGRIILAVLFFAAGINHFVNSEFYLRIMPPYLPGHLPLVLISGAAESALGVGLLIPSLKKWAAWGLIALLIAVFPANIHMAMHPELFPEIPATALWLRLPLQALLILWASVYTRPEPIKTA